MLPISVVQHGQHVASLGPFLRGIEAAEQTEQKLREELLQREVEVKNK